MILLFVPAVHGGSNSSAAAAAAANNEDAKKSSAAAVEQAYVVSIINNKGEQVNLVNQEKPLTEAERKSVGNKIFDQWLVGGELVVKCPSIKSVKPYPFGDMTPGKLIGIGLILNKLQQ